MIPTWDEIAAKEPSRPDTETIRHHVLEGILRRLALLPHAESFVLRGGMLMRWWARPVLRPAQDLDLVGNFPFDIDETVRRFKPIVVDREVQDGVAFDPASFVARGIWLHSEFPGVRLFLKAQFERARFDLQLDVGFNDPLIPSAERMSYPLLRGDLASLYCVRVETALSWKLHGLAEKGPRRWRPKDLYDSFLMIRLPMHDAVLPAALEAAFTSRGYAVSHALEVLESPTWWTSKIALVKWHEFYQADAGLDIPQDLATVVAAVRDRLLPAVRDWEHSTRPREGNEG